MANLITEKQKKIIKLDYLARLFSVSLLIPTSLLGLFLLAYIVPYYLSVSKKDAITAEQFRSTIGIENKENTGESSVRILNQSLDQMKTVENYSKNSPIPSVYLEKVIKNKNSSIKINKISFSDLKNGSGLISISGISVNREGLVSFIEDLKSKANLTTVESPISNFAKDSDISFVINIKTVI